MADWQRYLNLADVWDNYESVQKLALIVAERLGSFEPFYDERLDNERGAIIEEFKSLADDENTDENDFDYIMHHLYDWGDISLDGRFNGKKVCWVKTF